MSTVDRVVLGTIPLDTSELRFVLFSKFYLCQTSPIKIDARAKKSVGRDLNKKLCSLSVWQDHKVFSL
jgi:hypothetical protein